MSFNLVCDICGKNSNMTGVYFTDEPMTTVIKNFKNKKYRIYLTCFCEAEEDIENVKRLSELYTVDPISCSEQISKFEFKTPNPHICSQCKRQLIYPLLKTGVIEEESEFTKLIKYITNEKTKKKTKDKLHLINNKKKSNETEEGV